MSVYSLVHKIVFSSISLIYSLFFGLSSSKYLRIIKENIHFFGDTAEKKILDIGCGTGAFYLGAALGGDGCYRCRHLSRNDENRGQEGFEMRKSRYHLRDAFCRREFRPCMLCLCGPWSAKQVPRNTVQGILQDQLRYRHLP